MRRRRVLGFLAAVLAGLAAGAAAPPTPPCERVSFEDARFTVCRFDPNAHELKLAWRGADGSPLMTFDKLQRSLGADQRRLRFAMNAGMFDPDHAPLGLYVESGALLRPLRTDDGEGNFYLKPNGVFWVEPDGTPHVASAEAYAAASRAPAVATQSGPMLVVDGALHPRFQPDGPSRLIRNGVGVRGREALFVISDDPVSFGRFARLFRDRLDCPNALYLDGSVSRLWAPRLPRRDAGPPLGPFVVVLDRE